MNFCFIKKTFKPLIQNIFFTLIVNFRAIIVDFRAIFTIYIIAYHLHLKLDNFNSFINRFCILFHF